MGDVLRLAQAAHGDALDHRLLAFWPVGLPLPLVVGAGAQEARRHGVDRDAARPELVGELAHQAELRGLGRGVGLDSGQADAQARAAGNHDDAALGPLLHARHHRAAGEERAFDVDGLDRAPIVVAHLLDRAPGLAAHAARDVHQHVDRAAGLLDLAHEAVDLGRLRQVDFARLQRAAALGLGPRLQCRQLTFQEVAGPHPGAAFDEALDDAAADPARGAGDDDGLVVELDV